ncbi:MAG: amidohydrolase [Planctomycetota bacterium]
MSDPADLVLEHGRFATLDPAQPTATAVAIKDGRFLAVGDGRAIQPHLGPHTRRVDLGGRVAIPGLNDSHLHVIRGGLHYMNELRWDGVPSLADALRMLREQAARTPAPQWVRVVGGWTEFQFAERRMPTLEELNAAAPDTPVFVLHLYARALLNRAAIRVLGLHADSPNPPGGLIQRDHRGQPTGLLVAEPNAFILYSTLARTPSLSREDQLTSSRQFMRELNRLGVTSAGDAGGGGQSYPDDYGVIQELADRGELSVRIAYSLFAQKPGEELADYTRWVGMTRPGQGDDYLRMNGAGENLLWAAADFENFLEPRPDLAPSMDAQLREIVGIFARERWPFRIHATYDESIARFLDVFEAVDAQVPFAGLRWWFDHAETVSERNLERIAALGGGIAIQHRMAYQGEYFVARYGPQAAQRTPPVRRMLELGLPVGGGTDATRVASYDPWVGLYWLVTGRTLGGLELYPSSNRLDRTEALRLYTQGSAWFSGEAALKGQLKPGQLADLAVLSADYFSVPAEEIRQIVSELTFVGGEVVYAAGDFADHAPPPLPVSPAWSPVGSYGGYRKQAPPAVARCAHEPPRSSTSRKLLQGVRDWFGGHDHGPGLACGCFAL